jgi:glycosyltransferase involved in cell wall biosynthesis
LERRTAAANDGPEGVRPPAARPRVDGKFFAIGDERLWVRGVTYGTFAPDAAGLRFGSRDQVRRDFEAMAEHGFNVVRTYTAPPVWVLEEADRYGLHVMAGLAWEQHIAFLDERGRVAAIEARVREQAAACAGHPALLCFAVGNEIPTPIVRWHGRRRMERLIEHLCEAVRDEDPSALLTYVNYPSTEYLRLPFLDFFSFNVYLDMAEKVSAYLGRLQNLAGEKPLLLAEVGVDSRSESTTGQARQLASQLEVAANAGAAGACVFAWTDEWHRGDDGVLDWDFGLTTRTRHPKPSLRAVGETFSRTYPPPCGSELVSVIVCTRNGARTLRRCLEGIAELRYPRYEVIVVDDGSTDVSAAIAAEFDVRLISIEPSGLSAARNVGLAAARGEIVVYLDDDAWPDPDWLRFLVLAFRTSDHAAIGGPNLPPADDGPVATCVANSPGGPTHVLLSDSEAEHIPGCNMAFRRHALECIGGFDPQFLTAGDDVDICWRLQDAGETLGFHAAAVVWHRRRDSLRAYWRQQVGYGRAEALLERKWPHRYNRRGHPTWAGHLYDRASQRVLRPVRIYHGVWGTGAFQPEDAPQRTAVATLVTSPDWYLVLATLIGASLLALVLPLLLWLVLCTLAACAVTLFHATAAAWQAERSDAESHGRRGRLVALTALLHLIQPAARLVGRLMNGLAPWRRSPGIGMVIPLHRCRSRWHEAWVHPQDRVRAIEQAIQHAGGRVTRGGPYDRWDFEFLGGIAGAARLLIVVEEHGRGRQLVRCRVWPRVAGIMPWLASGLGATCAATVAARAWTGTALAGTLLALLVATVLVECGHAVAAGLAAFETVPAFEPVPVAKEAAASSRASSVAAIAMEEA